MYEIILLSKWEEQIDAKFEKLQYLRNIIKRTAVYVHFFKN